MLYIYIIYMYIYKHILFVCVHTMYVCVYIYTHILGSQLLSSCRMEEHSLDNSLGYL